MIILNFLILLLKLMLCSFLLKPILDLFLQSQVQKQLRVRVFELLLSLLAKIYLHARRIEIYLLEKITH